MISSQAENMDPLDKTAVYTPATRELGKHGILVSCRFGVSFLGQILAVLLVDGIFSIPINITS
jgi:hypothetical protein